MREPDFLELRRAPCRQSWPAPTASRSRPLAGWLRQALSRQARSAREEAEVMRPQGRGDDEAPSEPAALPPEPDTQGCGDDKAPSEPAALPPEPDARRSDDGPKS